MRIACLFVLAAMGFAQEEPPAVQSPKPPVGRGGGGGAGGSEPEIRPYDRVITKEARSSKGLFSVHRIKSRVYYEIPASELGKDMLWVSQLAQTTLGAGYGGSTVGRRVVRWERRDQRVLLSDISYDVVAKASEPISRAVRAANHPSVLMAFNIEALGPGEAPVIDVTRLFTSEVPEFSARRALRARGFDSARSLIESVKVFPENINVAAMQTYTASTDTPGGPGSPPAESTRGGAMRGSSATVVLHHSMVKLPEKPMQPRLEDERVGYFSIRKTDYGLDEHKAATRNYITRWRLEKKDPAAAVSEPVKPIVYYVDPATPSKWVPYVKKGIEDWQPAFEEAGFRKAILAAEAPNDPDWSPEDARVSVVRWLPSTIQNAQGPHVHDPRTGEILESDILMYHNVLELQRNWYFAQVAPLDKRAQKLPLPDDLMGEAIRFVVAHEVGHTLGLPHNMKASSTYPFDKIRDKEWLRKMGHTPTIMDYSRFNYVAQPEDGIPPADLIPRVGPYDKFAIVWGYKPVPGANSPEAELPTLQAWLKPQETTPWLRFSTARSRGSDPGELTEAVGDADAVKATALGTKNLQRVVDLLLTAVPKQGEPYDELGNVYASVVGQWVREVNHVAALVGGYDSQQKHGGQPGVLFTPVPRQRQKEAVQFLNAQVFTTPRWLVRPEIDARLEPAATLNRLVAAQRSVLGGLLSQGRIARLSEQEALGGGNAYAPTEFLADLRSGIFAELASPTLRVDGFRRNLQRAYLELVNDRLNSRPAPQQAPPADSREPRSVGTNTNDDMRGLLRAELRTLAGQLRSTGADAATRAHVEDMRDRIATILDPKLPPPAAPATPTFGRGSGLDGECWPDLAILPDTYSENR